MKTVSSDSPVRNLLNLGRYALGAALVLAPAILLSDGLGSSDPWRHIRWANLLVRPPPLSLREWPVFTLLHQRDVDLWWLFHWLLVPFSLGDLYWGAKLAALFYGALSLGAVGFVLHRLDAKRAPWVFFAMLAFGATLFFRATLARPSTLTVALLVLAAWANLERRPWLAGLFAFLHGWLHVSVVLQAVGALALLFEDAVIERRLRAAPFVAVAAGAWLGIFARPHPLSYIDVALQLVQPFRAVTTGFADLGPELYPPALRYWLLLLPIHLAIALSWRDTWAAVRNGQSRRGELTLALTAGAYLVLGSRAARFLELEVAFAAIYAAVGLRLAPIAPLWARFSVRTAAAGLVGMGLSSNIISVLMEPYPYRRAHLVEASAALQSAVPPGAVVFHDDWRSWAKLFFHDPSHRYIVGADPTLMSAVAPELFWLWWHLGHQGRVCTAPTPDPAACPSGPPTAEDLEAAFARFGARAIVLSDTEDRPELKRALRKFPERFPVLFENPRTDPAVAVYLIRAKPGRYGPTGAK